MTEEMILAAINRYREVITKHGFLKDFKEKRDPEASTEEGRLGHLLSMCTQIEGFLQEYEIEKAMRWLGFIQGALWATGMESIEALKSDNRSAEDSNEGSSAPSTWRLETALDAIKLDCRAFGFLWQGREYGTLITNPYVLELAEAISEISTVEPSYQVSPAEEVIEAHLEVWFKDLKAREDFKHTEATMALITACSLAGHPPLTDLIESIGASTSAELGRLRRFLRQLPVKE